MAVLANLLKVIQASFWFRPLLILLISLAAAAATAHFDLRLEKLPGLLGRLALDRPVAELLLPTLAGAIITVMALVFSMTFVAVSVASSQLGPRLIKRLEEDVWTQFAIGIFLATFLFCVVALYALGAGGKVFVPRLTILITLALAVLSLLTLVFFIHHLTKLITADAMLADLAGRFLAAVPSFFPRSIDADGSDESEIEGEGQVDWRAICEAAMMRAPKTGYIASIDTEKLVKIAAEADLRIVCHNRPGQFTVEGMPLLSLIGGNRPSAALTERLGGTISIADERIYSEDIELPLHSMIEIGLRALSPGINDPYTAIAAIDRLGGCLAAVLPRRAASEVRYDEAGRPRLHVGTVRFSDLLDAAFHPIRQNVGAQPSALIRAADTLSTLASLARAPDQRAAIHKHQELLRALASRSLKSDIDRQDFRRAIRSREAFPMAGRRRVC